MACQRKEIYRLPDALDFGQYMLVRIDNVQALHRFEETLMKLLRRSVRGGRQRKERASVHHSQDSSPCA